MLNFYADWCRFSQMLRPIFDKAADALNQEFPVSKKKKKCYVSYCVLRILYEFGMAWYGMVWYGTMCLYVLIYHCVCHVWEILYELQVCSVIMVVLCCRSAYCWGRSTVRLTVSWWFRENSVSNHPLPPTHTHTSFAQSHTHTSCTHNTMHKFRAIV